MLRSILAVITGYIVSLFVLICLTILAVVVVKTESATFEIILILLSSTIASIFAGYLTTLIAQRQPILHTVILGVITVLMNAVVIAINFDDSLTPYWVNLSGSLIALPACWLGGFIRSRILKSYDNPPAYPPQAQV